MSRTFSWLLVAVLAAMVAYLAIERFGTPTVSRPYQEPITTQPDRSAPWGESDAAPQREITWGDAPRPRTGGGQTSTGGAATDPAAVTDALRPGDSAAGQRDPADQAALTEARRTAREVRQRAEQMQGIQRELLGMMNDPANLDIQNLTGIVDRMIETQGSAVIGGIDMSRLRESLQYSQQMTEIGREMHEAFQNGAGEAELQMYAERFEEASLRARALQIEGIENMSELSP